MTRDPLTELVLERLREIVAQREARGESVYSLCQRAGLNRKWYDDLTAARVQSPTLGKLHAFLTAAGMTIYDLLDRPVPLNVELLQQFIEEALKYRGALSSAEVARVVARAYARHPQTGMTAEELGRHLDLLEPGDVPGVSR